jgi:hypothetical protein
MLLLASCVSARAPAAPQDARLAHFQHESQQIEDREIRCIRGVLAQCYPDVPSITIGGGASKDDPRQQVTGGENESLYECKAKATREKEALSERERRQYHDNAQKERGHESLMMILTGGPR